MLGARKGIPFPGRSQQAGGLAGPFFQSNNPVAQLMGSDPITGQDWKAEKRDLIGSDPNNW